MTPTLWSCTRPELASVIPAVIAYLVIAGSAFGQSGVCALVADKRHPGDVILHCGGTLTVKPAPGTVYHPPGPGEAAPSSLRLDSGALLIEFHGNGSQQGFQILTPQAIAGVRGTKWAVEVQFDRTSVLTLAGTVNVKRANEFEGVRLGPGEGVDVNFSSDPLQVKRWKPERVKALLARFAK